jgi:hypothetical protein
VDRSHKKPVPFTNIGILNSSIGTISNEDGSFMITVPDNRITDSLMFASLGYATRAILISTLLEKKSDTIYLSEISVTLQEVTVRAKKEKRKEYWLGNTEVDASADLSSADEASAGAAMALLIENRSSDYVEKIKYPLLLERAMLRISTNTLGYYRIRVRVYDVDSIKHTPGKDLLNQSVLIGSSIKDSWLDFDLSPYAIQVDKPFFIAFELLLNQAERKSIAAKYRKFERQHRDRFHVDTTFSNGQKVIVPQYINFSNGVTYSVSTSHPSQTHFQSYSRLSSLDIWKRNPYVLSAKVKLVTQMKRKKK